MRVIARKTLSDFWASHPRAEQPLKAWFAEACEAIWRTPQDIKDLYRNTSFVGTNRVVFNIAGDLYRLVTVIHYRTGIVYIRFVGRHVEYDRIEVEKI